MLALVLWLVLERSRLGAMVRAGVDDSAMAAGLGGNVPALFTGVFSGGVALAALGGVAAGPILGVYAGMDADILIPAFIVIVVGGMGSLRGAFLGSLLIGEADTFGKAYLPDLALFFIYLVMAVVLLARPQGMFGITRAPLADRAGRQRAGTRRRRTTRASWRSRSASCCALLSALRRRLSARAHQRGLHLRHLRDEPRPVARLYRAQLAWATRRSSGSAPISSSCSGRCSASTRGSGVALGVVAAAALGAVIGYFCVRISGIPFLMLTLAFSQLVYSVALKWRDVTGGSDGIGIPEKPSFFGFDLSNSLTMYYMALIVLRRLLRGCCGSS